MKRIDAAGISAIIIAVCLGAGWAGSLLILAIAPRKIADGEAQLLSGLGQILAGALATYLGAKIAGGDSLNPARTRRPKTPPDIPPTEPAPADPPRIG